MTLVEACQEASKLGDMTATEMRLGLWDRAADRDLYFRRWLREQLHPKAALEAAYQRAIDEAQARRADEAALDLGPVNVKRW